MAEKYCGSQGKVREFCQSGKVGTLTMLNLDGKADERGTLTKF